MGNHRFRLSDMMPNSWFYKLRDMGRTTTRPRSQTSTKRNNHHHHHHHHNSLLPSPKPIPLPPPKQPFLPNRPSYYLSTKEQTEKPCHSPAHPKAFDTHFPIDPPRESNKRSRRKPVKPSSKLLSSSFSKSGRIEFDSGRDIVININNQEPFKDFDALSDHHLPPILTKSTKKNPPKAEFSDQNPILKRNPSAIHRVKVKQSTPRIQFTRSRKKAVAGYKGSLSESFVVVKSSSDPQKDFRESMVEMIIENDIRASRDLEELLACYLSLNSNEYHDVIVKVFEQIWFDLTEVRL